MTNVTAVIAVTNMTNVINVTNVTNVEMWDKWDKRDKRDNRDKCEFLPYGDVQNIAHLERLQADIAKISNEEQRRGGNPAHHR